LYSVIPLRSVFEAMAAEAEEHDPEEKAERQAEVAKAILEEDMWF
jgi:hypothetical protein